MRPKKPGILRVLRSIRDVAVLLRDVVRELKGKPAACRSCGGQKLRRARFGMLVCEDCEAWQEDPGAPAL